MRTTSGVAADRLTLDSSLTPAAYGGTCERRPARRSRWLGIRIAIDDCGTGYSSLLYLERFPVDLLEIDRPFIRDLGDNSEDRAIVRCVIDLAHAFDIGTVAEGIETRQQLGWLKDAGCHLGQGFLWSPGRPAVDLGSPVGRRMATG